MAINVETGGAWSPSEKHDDDDKPLISIKQIISILRVYWKLSALIFALVVALTVVLLVLTVRTYSATVTLVVNHKSLDPLATKEFADGAPNSYLPTQMELMQSDPVLDSAIERLKLTLVSEFADGNNGGEATLRDWVEAKLRRNIDIEQGRGGSDLIYLTASAGNAALAAAIANGIADAYVEHLFVSTAGPSSERASRYNEELAQLKQKVEQAQNTMAAFRAKSGSVDIDSKGEVELDILNALEHRLLDAKNVLRSSQARASGKQDLTTSLLSSNSISNLRETGTKLSSQMAQLRAELGPNHPDVIALQSQIDSNRASLSAAMSAYSNANTSDISVTNSEVASLERAVAEQRSKVMHTKQYHGEAAKYQLELESAQNVYKRALDGYDQANFAANGQQTNLISIASRARAPLKPVKPNKLKYLMLGSLAGLVLALGIPFLLDIPRRRVRIREDLELDFGIPVLAELSAVVPLTSPTDAGAFR